MILCATVVLEVVIGGRGSAAGGTGGVGVSFDIVVVLVERGMKAATEVISVVLRGMENNNVSSDEIIRRPSRSALERIQ